MSKRTVKDKFVEIDAELITLLTPSEFMVYALIQRGINDQGVCQASISEIAKDADMSQSSVKRCLKSLAEKNVLRKVKRLGNTDIYSPTSPEEWKCRGEG